MIAQYDNSLNISTYLWAAHRAANTAQAYSNLTTPLYPVADRRFTGFYSYAAPFKGWIYDSGVSGAQIINVISGGDFTNYPLTRASGIHFDYLNGRVMVPVSFGANLTLTGSYSVPDFNFYLVNETEEQLLTQNKYFQNPRYNGTPTSGISPYVRTTPVVFINSLADTSEAFALGGLDDTTTTFSLVVLAESDYQLKGIISLFRDAARKYIPLISVAQNPFDEFNDVKGGTGFNYNTIISQYGTPGNLIYIKAIRTAKTSDKVNLNIGQYAGIVDMDLSFVRQTV